MSVDCSVIEGTAATAAKLTRLITAILALLLVSLPCQATSLTGYGRSETASGAKQIALADLALVMHTAAQTRFASALTGDQRKPAVRRVMQTGSELPILGTSLKVVAERKGFLATAVLDSGRALPIYKQKLRAIKRKIVRLDGMRVQTHKRGVLTKLLTEIDRYYKHKLMAMLLGVPQIGDLAVSEANIKTRLGQLDKSIGNLDLAARLIARGVNQPKQVSIYIHPPTAHYARETTHFASVLKDRLTAYLPTTGNVAQATHVMEGEYEFFKQGMLLTYRLQDANHDTLKTEVVKLSPKVYREYQTKPRARDFSRQLHRGLVRGLVAVDLQGQESIPEDITAAGSDAVSPPVRDFRVSLQTDKGWRGLSYRIGEKGRLLLRMTQPGYFYIVGHIDKQQERYSYLLELRPGEGDRRFVSFLNPGDVHKWIDLGEFDVVRPLGSEALQVVASSEDLVATLPPNRFDAKTGLYITDDDPKRAMRNTRAIVLSAIKKDKAKNHVLAKERAQYAEAVLEFTTLPPR